MKRLLPPVALVAVLTLAACDDPRPAEPEAMDAPMEEVIAEPADAAAAPVVDPATDIPLDPDPQVLPADPQSSEESVQPESETLFY